MAGRVVFAHPKVDTATGIKHETGVAARSDLSADEYTQVAEHMEANLHTKPAKKAKTTPTKQPESEEQKLRRFIVSKRKTCLTKWKALIDKSVGECTMWLAGIDQVMSCWCSGLFVVVVGCGGCRLLWFGLLGVVVVGGWLL